MILLDGESKTLQTNFYEICGGYYKGHIKLHIILGMFVGSRCWWIISLPM